MKKFTSRPCYEYDERRGGNQAFPHCKTRYKRIKDVVISAEKHALIVPPFMHCGRRIHPIHFLDSSIPAQPRPMDPKKDLAFYGYGSVAWKERMEEWKKKHNEKLEVALNRGLLNGNLLRRESMKNSKCGLMHWLQWHKRRRRMAGQCMGNYNAYLHVMFNVLLM
ncbi:hypothetical protein HN51_036175 [Arachis hypogaea]